ncbi:PREDICTED: thyrotropin-releasing hormone receptor [Vollenhovia emeryi]|uniref:thyrotropin-releasing hormone receptor n=1 Tax=Vollenhovia emeryi TaxID=411798 RepID=UPI0005F46527|nr:PREDICTED: thyrotropin-releasing hormone receptor [Vollenhovia emeryi]
MIISEHHDAKSVITDYTPPRTYRRTSETAGNFATGVISMIMQNYTDLFRRLNITEEDIDYANSLGIDGLAGRNDNRFGSRDGEQVSRDGSDRIETTQLASSCYCEGVIRDLATQYKNYHGYASLVVCSFGTFTNMLNIIVLTRQDTKTAPINRILTGLATADVLVMLEYIPFAIYKYLVLPERRIFPYGWAVFVLFHMHFTQLFHTISIALTLTLAVWRYIAIRFPQYSHTWCTGRRCTIALSCSFFAPLLTCAPSYLVFGIKTQTVYENGIAEVLYHVDADYSIDKGFLYQLNFWILGVVVKLLPCVLLTVIICWLIKILYRTKGRKRTLKSYSDCAVKVAKPTGLSGIPDLDNCNEAFDNNKKDGYPRRTSKSDKQTDRTTRMLVVVLLLFLMTEIPQGILGLLSAALGDCFFRNCYHKFGELMDILALLNGSINFILYCSMSRQFRMIFGQLFKPRIINNWSMINQHQTDVQSTYV